MIRAALAGFLLSVIVAGLTIAYGAHHNIRPLSPCIRIADSIPIAGDCK
jgi:hypothetical protein